MIHKVLGWWQIRYSRLKHWGQASESVGSAEAGETIARSIFPSQPRLRFFHPGTGQLRVTMGFVAIAGAAFLGVLLTTLVAWGAPHLMLCQEDSTFCSSLFYPGAWQDLGGKLASLFGIAVLGMVIAFVVGILASHRVFGPMVRIYRMVDALREGRYAERVNLRDGDYFMELAAKLNELAENLERKHGELSRAGKAEQA